MTEQDLKIYIADLKDKLEQMDVYTFISYARKMEYGLLKLLQNDNQTGIDVDTLGNGKIVDYLITDEYFKNELGEKIISEASSTDTWRYFRNLLNENIDTSTLLNIFRDDNLAKASANQNVIYILMASMTEKDPIKVLEFALENDEFYKEYKKIAEKNNIIPSYINYDIIRRFIDKDIDFVNSCIPLSRDSYIEIINDKTISNDELYKVFRNIRNIEVANEFYQHDPRRKTIFDRLSINETRNLLDKNISFDITLLDDDKVLEALKSSSVVDFRRNINRFEDNNPSYDMEEKVRNYYEKTLSSYNPESNMFKVYETMLEDINKNGFISSTLINYNDILFDEELYRCRTKEEFIRISERKIKEITTDFIFKDNTYNVDLNIKELERFENNNTPINIERENRLNTIVSMIKDNDGEKVIMLFNRLKNGNTHELYYDAIRETKEVVNQRIKDGSIMPSKGFSIINGCEVYDMRNSKFYMLARTLSYPFREDTINERDCYSLISDENTSLLYDDRDDVYFYGYEDFDPKRILHIFEGDAFSTDGERNTTKYVNRLMTPKDIVTSNGFFSEIQYKNIENGEHRYKALKPSNVIAIDKITEKEIEESKRLSIPIRLISKKHMTNSRIVSFDDSHSVYVESSFEERLRKK